MKTFAAASLLALLLFPVGCSDEETQDSDVAYELVAGDATLSANASGLTWSLSDKALLRFPKEAFQWGTVATISDLNYDPYREYVPHPLYVSPEINWISPEKMAVTESNEKTLVLQLTYPNGASGTVTFEAAPAMSGAAPSRVAAHWKPNAEVTNIAYFRLMARASEAEGFYGLGEYFDEVNHRGQVRAMQIEIDGGIESGYNEAHVPVPFVIGTSGFGLFVDSERPGVFALATTEKDLVEAAFGTAPASAEGLRFHLFAAPHPLDVPLHYYQITGFPALPAPWALGPWVWRDENKDQAEFLADANTLRDKDLATTAMWIDRPYATAVNTFDFSKTQFPDPQAMIDEAHGLGLELALWHTPYLDEKSQTEETAALRKEAEDGGYFPITSGLPLNKWGRPIDFTDPNAFAFWQSLIEKYTEMGISGFKLDYAEDIVPGLTNARNVWEFEDGSDERTMNGGYQRFYHKVYAETLPPDGGFLLCRGGTHGDQVHVSVIWPGDLDASFGKHREKQTDSQGDSYFGVGGLPASIVAGLSLGASGFPFFGADTGGYKHSPPDKELFTRWFEQTAFSTVMQIGTGSNTVAWDFASGPGFDDEMLDLYRFYTRLHLRLFPYIYSHAKAVLATGRPVARPLGLAFPEMLVHPNDVYLFGDDLLVAPVIERGKTSKEVVFPPGVWIDFWTGESIEGPSTKSIPAPLGTIPVYFRKGGIVPLLRPTIDTLSPTTSPDLVDSYATTKGLLYVKVAPSGKSALTLFDGGTLETTAENSADGTEVTLTHKQGTDFTSGTLFEMLSTPAPPKSGLVGGEPIVQFTTLEELMAAGSGTHYTPENGGTLYVLVPASAAGANLTLPTQ